MLAASVAAVARGAGPGWEHDDTEDGVALYTREVSAHPYDVVRAVTTIDGDPRRLVALLRDVKAYPRWYHDCKRAQMLEHRGHDVPVTITADGGFGPTDFDERTLVFFLQESSPIDDRWAVIENHMTIAPNGSLLLRFRSLDRHPYPAQADAVRMKLEGRWVLSPLSANRTRVTFELDIDPRTSMPTFLVDPKIHDAAVETLRNLRRLARRPD
ncbi:MAG: START domain-containing protein [Myxococcales bacterium]